MPCFRKKSPEEQARPQDVSTRLRYMAAATSAQRNLQTQSAQSRLGDDAPTRPIRHAKGQFYFGAACEDDPAPQELRTGRRARSLCCRGRLRVSSLATACCSLGIITNDCSARLPPVASTHSGMAGSATRMVPPRWCGTRPASRTAPPHAPLRSAPRRCRCGSRQTSTAGLAAPLASAHSASRRSCPACRSSKLPSEETALPPPQYSVA